MNNGDGKFTEEAERFGLAINAASVMMCFADYDLDGDLDGYLVTNRLVTEGGKHVLPKNSQAVLNSGILQRKQRSVRVAPEYEDLFAIMSKGEEGRFELVIAGQEDVLLRNDGGVFRTVNREAGITGHGIGLSAVWWDYDGDGWPDLYVSNDYKGADQLYHNNGDGSFTNVIETICPHTPWYSMGADVGDINNDGWVDLFASDMSGTSHYRQKVSMGDMSDDAWFLDLSRPPQYMRNTMFVNPGGGRMLEVAQMAGISSTDWTWSPKFGDLDNDGLLDLFVANGMSRDFMHSDLANVGSRSSDNWKEQPILREKNLAFRNKGDLEFEEVGELWGLDELSASYGASLADLDRDGDLDLVTTDFDGPLLVYENQTQTGNRLLLKLVGTTSNRQGIGARVSIRTSDGQQTRVVTTAQGFMSSNESLVHFGLGDASVDAVTIRWPSGIVQELDGPKLNTLTTITEPATPVGGNESQDRSLRPVFTHVETFSAFRHRERPFDDYAAQPLLPAKKSQRGPGVACADINGDRADDFYFGGASGSAGSLVLGGVIRDATPAAIVEDSECEDMGAIFFDADADGDLDLYVVSGGVEAPNGSPLLRDRLYIQSNGEFLRGEGVLPPIAESGSCVCASDFDRDGDLDLFVGGHCVPGSYPHSSPSRLLRNDGGMFADATEELAPDLLETQLVNGAIWSDANGDGAADLIVAQAWGTIDVFLNRNGRLEKSNGTGLSPYTGWWNGIVGGDIDGDGDIDYVVTNIGLNTKYHADPEHPVRLFTGDFDGGGKQRLVEAKYDGGILLPERGKSCSTAAMPILASRFSTYEAFALAGLEEVYTKEALDNATSLSATTLESGILINDGSAHYEFRPLPRFAQIAPSSGAVLTHLDGDGHLDLVLAQNDFSPQRETGRMDGGVSLFLRGDGLGGFVELWPHQSGISVGGDAQCVVVTDLNRDHRPDLIFGVNDQPWTSFVSEKGDEFLVIRLVGAAGNPTAVGARVEVELSSGRTLMQETYAGSGYLSQSGSELFFGVGRSSAHTVHVTWPDGSHTTSKVDSSDMVIERAQ